MCQKVELQSFYLKLYVKHVSKFTEPNHDMPLLCLVFDNPYNFFVC